MRHIKSKTLIKHLCTDVSARLTVIFLGGNISAKLMARA